MSSRIIAFLFAFLISLTGFSQEYNYVRYDTRDGLAGSTVYDMCQDVDGFMWFATENGVSRFDGYRFTNFTVKEGLPDNEILKIFADSRGRVWFGSLSKELSFYYKGKIHNKHNDGLLADNEMQINGFVFAEDRLGNFYVTDYKNLIKIDEDRQAVVLTDSADFKIRKGRSIYIKSKIYDKQAIIGIGDSTFELIGSKLRLYYVSDIVGKKMIGVKILPSGKPLHVKFQGTVLSETSYGPSNFFISTTDGAWSVDTINIKLDHYFLPGKQVSKTIVDSEGDTWFSTLGEGIFKLPSRGLKTFHFSGNASTNNKEVYSIANNGTEIVAGLGFSRLTFINKNYEQKILDFSKDLNESKNSLATNRLYKILASNDGGMYLGFDAFLLKYDNGKSITSDIISIKSIHEIDHETLLVGNYACCFLVNKKDLSIRDTLFYGRTIDAIYHHGNYYFGTQSGLFQLSSNKPLLYLGDSHQILKRRIVRLGSQNSIIYVATADKGLVILKNGKIERILDENTGLNSNICKTLFISDQFIWLGTNRGINKISISDPARIVKYSSSDGLPSDVINDIVVLDSMVWVASPEGLTYFNEKAINSVSQCKLLMLKIEHNGTKGDGEFIILPYEENSISFQFAAVSQKSAGGIYYFYKVTGLDSSYTMTVSPELSFLSLAPGSYKLSLYAVNKFDKKSETFEYAFVVATPFWRTSWFYIFLILAVAILTVFILIVWNRIRRKQLAIKSKYVRQLAGLEQQALQSQMNPHFIFNCLNSIQQFVLTNEKKKANEYLSKFAGLIEQTLDISQKPNILLSTEINYLYQYLEMEKMRFGNNFSYTIQVDSHLDIDKVLIPSLLLQPYVENSIRHGLRYKEQEEGKLIIKFNVRDHHLYCHIIDNGIGRQKSFELKAVKNIEYQSKGIQLTAKRIRLINLVEGSELKSEIIDHIDDFARPTGTEVIVKIPIN